jgi:3-methyladenine DNA glycosylase AlkD
VRRTRREILREHDSEFLVGVADELFSGSVLEEKVAAVFLLEKMDAQFGDREFELFESWLDRISSWADHDGLVHYLIAPMVAAKPARVKTVFRWAKSPNRWHRRAACVALIRGARAKMLFAEIVKLSDQLPDDPDDMVQKGLGWLLRETGEIQRQTHRAIFDKDSPASSAAGTSNRLRNAAGGDEKENSGKEKIICQRSGGGALRKQFGRHEAPGRESAAVIPVSASGKGADGIPRLPYSRSAS